jgi:diguanylate cyclase (GGDEF)-like protein/PAS domain S-box-containing protein
MKHPSDEKGARPESVANPGALADVEALRGIIDAIPHPIFVKDAECRFLVVNETMCSLMGRSFSDLVGKSDYDFVPTEQADTYHQNDRRVLDEGQINENEEPFTDAEGVVRTIVTRKKRLTLSDGTALLVGCITDISDFRRAEAIIRHHAEHDYLTGLANRSLFKKQLDEAVRDTEEARCSAALLLIDLDNFKGVNDALGHGAGDNILVQTANALTEVAGHSSAVARLGGDEFAVVQRADTQPCAARKLAEATVARLARPTFVGSTRVAVSASIGVAFACDTPSDSQALLRRADLALYAAKADGRSRWRLFDPVMEIGDQG